MHNVRGNPHIFLKPVDMGYNWCYTIDIVNKHTEVLNDYQNFIEYNNKIKENEV